MKNPLRRKCPGIEDAQSVEDGCNIANHYALEPLEPRVLLAADLGAGLDVSATWTNESNQPVLIAEAFDETTNSVRSDDVGLGLNSISGVLSPRDSHSGSQAPIDLDHLSGLFAKSSNQQFSSAISDPNSTELNTRDSAVNLHEVVFLDTAVDGLRNLTC